jgi:tetratricopeptide (TPR) repeat protein
MVKLVEYSDSDEASDAGSWASLGQPPSSPSDSFSYPMRSPESDEESEDEDYAPSETSLDGAGSAASSVDTEDLNPHEETGEEMDHQSDDSEDVIDLTHQEENQEGKVFYAWEDLQSAFADNPFKRRSVAKEGEATGEQEEAQEDGHASQPNVFDVEEGRWAFAAGAEDKKAAPAGKRTPVAHRPTGVSPKFSEMFASEMKMPTQDDEKEEDAGSTTASERLVFEKPRVDTTFSFGSKTPQFTFGQTGAATFGDTFMQSPSPQHPSAAPFAPSEGEFTIGRSSKAPKPYTFAGQAAASASSFPTTNPTAKAKDADDGDDTLMRSPSPQVKPSGTPTNVEFLFGQGYKNRKPYAWGRQSSAESAPASGSAPAAASASTSTPARFSTSSEPSLASTFFTYGVSGRNARHRNADRRKKKASVPPPNGKASAAAPLGTTSTFGSSLFQAATATRHRPDAPAAAPAASSGGSERDSGAATGRTDTSFVFGGSKAKPPGTDAPPFRSSVFGSAAAPATSNAVPHQGLFGTGTSHDPFEFDEADAKARPTGANAHFAQPSSAAVTSPAAGFSIGSADPKKRNSRVRPRKGGMFASKNSPRKDAKLGGNEPEPSPGFSSASSCTPSPFGLHNRRSRKNARLRQTNGRSPPADPFVTPTYPSHAVTSSTEGGRPPNVVRPTATPFGSGPATTTSPSRASQPGKAQHSNGDGARPAFAGSRRILRAALRNVGARDDRPNSAPPHATSHRRDEGDADMDSEDERDWLELKRLGGVAHRSQRYEEAVEFYRQSIEVLESLLYHKAEVETDELRTDKAKLHANRAASLMMLTQITEAQHECRRSIEVDATYARAYLRLGRIQVMLGETAHAQANIDTARSLMEDCEGDVSSGDHEDYASLVKIEATIRKLNALLGDIKWYVDCGDLRQALVNTESALALAPSCRKLQIQKARILLHQREFNQLVAFCTAIVEKQSGKQSRPASRGKSAKHKAVDKITFIGVELGLLWATTLHYQNKVEDAVRILNALEAVAPCSSNVIQLKRQWQEMKQLKHSGNERFKRAEYQEALRFYSEALQIDPQHQEYCAIIYCNRAAAQMGLERYHTAILDCNESLQRKPDFPRALLRRARCHGALKMYHEAVKDFDRYLHAQPTDLPAEATANVRRERNEAKAAIAKAREEARQREATKKRAEREQRQQRSHPWEESSWKDGNFYEHFRRGASSNGASYGSRHQSAGTGGRASFMAPKTQRRTHYDVLGIEKAATVDQIKKAYRKLALVYHPDKAKTSTHAELFKEMTAAYNVLSDESARAKYDRELIYNRFGNFYEN